MRNQHCLCSMVVEDKVCSARGQNWRCGVVEEEIRLFASPPFGEAIPNAGIPEKISLHGMAPMPDRHSSYATAASMTY